MNKGQKIKIVWNDAVLVSPKRKGDTPVIEDILPSQMQTVGLLEAEYDDYVLVKNPQTIKTKTGQKYPEKDPTFYLIPRGMIVSVERI